MLPIEILVEAVVVIGSVLQKQRRRPGLARLMTSREKLRVMLPDIACRFPSPHSIDWRSVQAEDTSLYGVLQRGVAEGSGSTCTLRVRNHAAPLRYDCGTDVVLSIESCYFPALLGRKNLLYDGTALLIEIARHTIPIDMHRANLAPSFVF